MKFIEKIPELNFYVIVIFVFVRIIFVSVFAENIVSKKFEADALEYITTAKNISDGIGFISNENNFKKRKYLGDNNYYSAEPSYPLYLSIFTMIGLSGKYVLLFSNSLLYLILLVYSFKIGELLKFSRIEHYFLFLLIIFNPHLEFYSFQLIPDLFRTTIFILLIFLILKTFRDEKKYYQKSINNTKVIILGIASSILVLSKITFIFAPIFLSIYLLIRTKNYNQFFLHILVSSLLLFCWSYRNFLAFEKFHIDPRFGGAGIKTTILNDEGVKNAQFMSLLRIEDNKLFNEIKLGSKMEKEYALSRYKDNIYTYIKMYLLKTYELLKPFPTGGQFSKLKFKIYSLFLYVPYFLGIFLLFYDSKILYLSLNPFICVSFIIFSCMCIHVYWGSGAHARYFLPFVPLGYIYFIYHLKRYNYV